MEHQGEELVLTRARAAARLRARDALVASERRAVRAARGEVGAAVRRVRARRLVAPSATAITAPVSLGASRGPRPLWRLAPAAAAAALALVILLVVGTQDPATAEAGSPAPATAEAVAIVSRESAISRGRSSDAVVFVAAAQPTPAPTPEPSTEPASAPAMRAPAAAPRATTGTGTGAGGTSGAGAGGNGRGTSPAPSATPPPPTPAPTVAPTPAPTPLPTLAPRAAGMTRFTGRVVDSRTGRAISGVCVIVGVRQCNARDVYTDTNGRFAIDLPVGSTWDVNFGRAGYASGYRRLVSSSARTTDIGTIRIAPRP